MKIFIAVVMLAAIFGLWQYNQKVSAQSEKAAIAAQNHKPFQPVGSNPATEQFTCDGRTHCSQMRSCAEATYFIQHCPNTQMDGNNDGVPCESQWCN